MKYKKGDYIYYNMGGKDNKYIFKIIHSDVPEKYHLKYIYPRYFIYTIHLSEDFINEYATKMSKDDIRMFYL